MSQWLHCLFERFHLYSLLCTQKCPSEGWFCIPFLLCWKLNFT